MDSTAKLPIQFVNKEGRQDAEDTIIRELTLTIVLNERELVTLLCSPMNLEYLAVGFLFSEGLIQREDAIEKIIVDNEKGIVRIETVVKELPLECSPKRLITSGGGRSLANDVTTNTQEKVKIDSQITVTDLEIFALAEALQSYSLTYKATGGVHSAALCDTKRILVFNEDIGRHNAIDKVFGECIINSISTNDRILIISGRISSEILFKVIRGNIPILISKAAPTDFAVKLANDLGVTLIGFVRGQRMNVYANGWRVITNGRWKS
ncbi:formate dehydrogenase accessory sulfurtransferase FdhD [Chloroflexota bacterium]